MGRRPDAFGGAVVAALIALATSVFPARAATPAGPILVGHPGTVALGITEAEFISPPNRCLTLPRTQGADGWVVNLPDGATNFSVTGSASVLFSLNVIFYRGPAGQCLVAGAHSRVGTSWSGSLPTSDTHWAVVSAVYGANITLSWESGP